LPLFRQLKLTAIELIDNGEWIIDNGGHPQWLHVWGKGNPKGAIIKRRGDHKENLKI
jgi:hypothetical protein